MTLKQPLSSSDLVLFKQARNLCVTRDGRFAYLTVEETGADGRKNISNIWRVPLTAPEPGQQRFTVGQHKDVSPKLSPDDAHLAFLSDRAGLLQPHVVPCSGGEAAPLATPEGTVLEFAWHPDGRRLFVLLSPWDESTAALRAHARGNSAPPVTSWRLKHIPFKNDCGDWLVHRTTQLWSIPIDGSPADLVTTLPQRCCDLAISPKGDRAVVCAANATSALQDLGIENLVVIDLNQKSWSPLFSWRGLCSRPTWNPDGTRVIFIGTEDHQKGWARSFQLFVSELSRPEPRALTHDPDLDFRARAVSDTFGISASPRLLWAPDGRHAFILCSVPGSNTVARIDMVTGSETLYSLPGGMVVDLDCDGNGTLFGLWSDWENPGDVRNLSTHKRHSDFNPWLAERRIFPVHELSVPSPHGDADILGWYVQPDGDERIPCVLYIHGGPWAQYGRGLFVEFQILAGQGIAVAYCNPHGSAGFGQDFCMSTIGAWGEKDFADQEAFLDAVLTRFPRADPKRQFVAGGSYGGYMGAWMITHNDRFRAAVTERGVYNLFSLLGTSDEGIFFMDYALGRRKFDADAIQHLMNRSPLAHVERARTPTLVIHSANDHRTAVEQAEQWFAALKSHGVETELLVFPEETHNLSRGGSPVRRRARVEAIVEWFKRHSSE